MEAIARPISRTPNAPRNNRLRRIGYWSLLCLFSVAMLMDGLAGIVREPNGQEAMRQLGYPMYVLVIVGTAKLLGIAALWQPRFRALTEWAFAGFTINFIGAFASWGFVNPQFGTLAPPVVMLVVLFILYGLRKSLR